jgi:hypothetical protein
MADCAERSGFLFPHRCGRDAVGACSRCQKAICRQHTIRGGAGEALCTTCARIAWRQRQWQYDDDDPYFYASRYYPDYYRDASEGPDPNDFTEGDQAALAGDTDYEGTGGDFGDSFEDDMGGS